MKVSTLPSGIAEQTPRDPNLQSGSHTNDRANTVEADVVLRVLDRHALGSIDHRRFRGVVPRQPTSGPETGRGSDVDEAAAVAFLLHVRDDHVGGIVNAAHVDSEDLVEVFVRDFVCGL